MSRRDRADERRTYAARLADTLREDIIKQVYAPGQALREAELAKRFDVSRIPLREALRQLEAEGFVSIRPYRGAVVTPISVDDGAEFAETRSALMQVAIRHGLPRLSDVDLRRLDELLDVLEGETDARRWGVLIAEFHGLLFNLPERPRLMALLQAQQRQSRRYLLYLHGSEVLRRLAERCLRELARVCRERDPERAARQVAANFDTMIDGFRAEARIRPLPHAAGPDPGGPD